MKATRRLEARLHWILWVIVLFAAAGAIVVAHSHRGDTPNDIYGDAIDYDELATTILAKGSYIIHHPIIGGFELYDTTCRPPGYPVFLALVYRIAGHRYYAAFLAQALLFVLTLLVVHRIWLHATRSESQALLATGLCACWPDFYLQIPFLLSEILAGLLIAVAVWFLLLVVEKPARGKCIGLGLVLGAGALVKPTILPFIGVAALFVVFSGKDRRRMLYSACLVVLAAAAVLVPWTVRNYRVKHALIPVCTGSGFNFWIGNWPRYYETDWPGRTMPAELQAKVKGKPDVEKDRILTQQAIAYMKEDPRRAAWIFALKFGRLWLGELGKNPGECPDYRILAIGSFGITKRAILYTAVFIAAVVGWFMQPMAARRRAYPLLALFVLWTLSYVIITSEMRYGAALQFYVLALASIPIWYLGRICLMKFRRN